MWPYWLMYLVLAAPALADRGVLQHRRHHWLFAGALLAVFVGWRFEVGGDWMQYFMKFQIAQAQTFGQALRESDPGFTLLNWAVGQLGLGYYSVNFLCGLVFISGLIAFARRQPAPWVAMAVAFPYLVLVVGMGYTRQGVALGFILMALVALRDRRFVPFLVYITFATLFHKTALIMIPLGFFLFGRGWLMRSLAIVAAAYVLYDALLAEDVDRLWTSYVDAEMESQGALIRVWMNAVPSIILLLFNRHWRARFPDYWFWFWIAIGSVVAVVFVDFASTAVDRISLYFIPIQIAVFSRLPSLITSKTASDFTRYGIVAGYLLVLYVWLNYASHAIYWIPYSNILFASQAFPN